MTNNLHFNINIEEYFGEDLGFDTPLTVLRDPKTQIFLNSNDFQGFYTYIRSKYEFLSGEMTRLLYNAGIDPLDHMTKIPPTFFSFMSDMPSTIIIPDNIKAIDAYAFTGCNIKFLDIPNSVEYIGEKAFAFCRDLKEIIFPQNLKQIEDNIFGNCSNLHKIRYKGTKNDFSNIVKNENWYSTSEINKIICTDGVIKIDNH